MLDQFPGYDFATITRVRHLLAQRGYVPIPCEGKRPLQKGWQERQAPSRDEIELWAKSFHLAGNTGVLTRHTPVIDIDVADRDLADAIEHLLADMFGERGKFLTRIGNPPKRAIPFRTDVPFAKLTLNLVAPNGGSGQKIEALGDGQQCIVFGVHPTTKQLYRWTHEALWTVERHELPLLHAEDVREFFARAKAEVIAPAGWKVKEDPKPNGNNADGAAPRADWVTLTANILAGTELHDSIVSLSASMVAEGASDQLVIRQLQALMQASSAPHDNRWRERYGEIERAVSSARAKFGPEAKPTTPPPPPPPLDWLDMSSWDNEPRPEREWAILNRVPLKQAGLFSGEGGAGKSIIEMMKDVAHVAGKDWLGSMPERGPAFYIGAEDDVQEIHIRFYDIARHYGITFKELIEGGLRVLCMLGKDATLCAANGKSGKVEPTQLYRQLYQAAGDFKPKNISIDTLSRAFAGNEIDRVQVYAFAMHMQALAMVAGGSVTVLSHPSLHGIASGSGYSGSTAWHGAFRFRQYLKGIKADEGEQPDGDLRQLEFKKNQYGPTAETIALRYDRGLFLPIGGVGTLDRLAAERKAEDLFLTLRDRFEGQGRNVSDKKGPSYAPALFARDPDAKTAGVTKTTFEQAMARLFAGGKIRVDTYGRPSRLYTRLTRAGHG